MLEVTERLREILSDFEEGTTQELCAQQLRVSIATYKNYRNGSRKPNVEFLTKMLMLNLDVIYLLTGKRSVELLSAEDSELLTLWHRADLTLRHAALNVLATGQAQAVVNHIGNITHSVIIGGINQNKTGGD